jgi:predicted phosphodiesterase
MLPISATARVGLIGDVHGEDAFLEAALGYFVEREASLVLCTGDIPDGYGSVARSCELLRDRGVMAVRGNHERWFLTGAMRDLPDATPLDAVPLREREYLAALPPVREFSTPLGGLLLCHGLGMNDMAKVGPDDEGYALVTNDELRSLMRDPRYELVVNGHTHKPMVRHFEGLTIVNAGTLRRDSDPGFLLLDFGRGVVDMLRWSDARVIVPRRTESIGRDAAMRP